jgi:hypothetical protein
MAYHDAALDYRKNEGNASSRESRESNNRKTSQVVNKNTKLNINGKPF